MMSTLSLLCLHHVLLGSAFELKATGDAQVRGGYSYTPFLMGPDTAPLLNAPASTQGAWSVNLVLTPGVVLGLKQRDFRLTLGYAPRIFFDLLNLTAAAPTVFHKLNLDLLWGDARTWLLSTGALVSVGGLDLAQAGGTSSSSAFSGGIRPGSGRGAFDFLNLSGYLKLEHPIGRDWHVSTAVSASKYDTPPLTAQAFLGGRQPGSAQVQGVGGTPTLQSMQRLDNKTEATYRLNTVHSLSGDIILSLASFAGSATYLGGSPLVGWTAQFNPMTRLTVDAGIFRYLRNPYPGIFEKARNMVVFDVSVQHTWANLGLPRLQSTLALQEGPYYDIVVGALQPRGSISLLNTYDLTRQWQISLQLRDYTSVYWDGKWERIPPGYDKNVAMLSAGLKYNYSSWLGFSGGAYGVYRWLEPSQTISYMERKELYFFLGVTGSYDVVE